MEFYNENITHTFYSSYLVSCDKFTTGLSNLAAKRPVLVLSVGFGADSLSNLY